MKYRINEIKLEIGEPKEALKDKLEKRIGCRASSWRISRESIDARDKSHVHYVYSLDFDADFSGRRRLPKFVEELAKPSGQLLSGAYSGKDKDLYLNSASEEPRPVVVGFGPCGIFAALILAEAGLRPIVLERGKPIDERVRDVESFWKGGALNPESNVQFGEGGAGSFSDGKLTTNIKDPRIGFVLETLHRFGADEDILYKQRPHVGTDVLRLLVKNIREHIISLGGDVFFQSRLEGLNFKDGRLVSASVSAIGSENSGLRPASLEMTEKGAYELPCESLVLALGHSSRDSFRMLHASGFHIEQKPFSIGVRVRHEQELINKAQYGSFAPLLPPADYKLSARLPNGRGVYTFCMCPGGEIINASSEEGRVCTNGMSYRARDGKYANSGLLVDVRTEDFGSEHPLAGMYFQEKYESLAFLNGGGDYSLPKTDYGSFKAAVYEGEALGQRVKDPVAASLPRFAAEGICEAMPLFGRKIKGFDDPETVFIGIESRSSSPIRILRDKNTLEAEGFQGVYPGGEGAGYAGGIVSAAVDGIRIAEKIIERFMHSAQLRSK